ncbi:MAG: biotin/lipoyl-containing protein [Pseudomonadota bacterium]|nr:biotin/lipoyl-containing protein [Pseudomonadota bacterium]
MKTVVFQIGAKKTTGKVQKIKDTLWVHLNGETFTFGPERAEKKRSSPSTKITGIILAPMPGKITKVDCNVGNSVGVGNVLISMEAMKMEYSLKADKTGKIKFVGCKLGDQVALGQKLVEIE